MDEIVFLNGEFLPVKEARLAALSPGVLYGWGLFETMRSYKNRIVYFNQHIKRIIDSCGLLSIKPPYPAGKLKDIISETVKTNGFTDSYVRLGLWKSDSGTDILVLARKYSPASELKHKKGLSVCVSRFRASEGSPLAQVKSANYLLFRLAYLEAKNKGFDEGIILNARGYIAEGTRSNIFLVKAGELLTPSLSCGCLDGITRRVIFDLAKKHRIKIYQGNLTLQDLRKADEGFLTNSLIGVMPIRGLKTFKLTRFLAGKYNYLLRHGI